MEQSKSACMGTSIEGESKTFVVQFVLKTIRGNTAIEKQVTDFGPK